MIRAGLDGAEARAHETIVVGSGPAGLTLAMELARRGRPTLVLESGLDRPSDAQDLARAEIVDPTRHDDMRIATVRRLGGTSNLWGGRSMPLDPVDFVPRPFVGGVRWPIGFDDVAPHYATACRYVGCGEAVSVAACAFWNHGRLLARSMRSNSKSPLAAESSGAASVNAASPQPT